MIDQHLREQIAKDYAPFDVRGGNVLDGGAHRGYATQMFLAGGAERVTAVEPHPNNIALWRHNVCDPQAHLLCGALGASDAYGKVKLYLSGGTIGPMSHSTVPFGNAKSMMVDVYPIDSVLKIHRITHLKLDVEAAEFELLARPLPAAVRWLAMEVHVRRKELRAQAPWLLRSLEGQGFEWVTPPPRRETKRWGFVVVGRR